jgi:hypothetical protein
MAHDGHHSVRWSFHHFGCAIAAENGDGRAELSRASGIVKPPNRPSEMNMTKTIACAIAALSLLAVTAPASAKGCIKGAIVGGVAGHMAGHGALGAAAGCAIGHHEANKPSNPQPSTTGSAPQSQRK